MKKAVAVVIGILSACTLAYGASGDLDVAGNINASGTRLGNPRLGIMGYSGGDYGSVGYGFLPTSTTGLYNYGLNDTASQLRFHSGGFQFKTAPAGTFGSPITWATPMTITSGGSVGIGTGSPSSPLEVVGNTNWASGWRHGIKITSNDFPTLRLHSLNSAKTSFIGNDNDGGLWFGINATDTAFGTYGMVIQPTGNIGIGTTSPAYKLDVSGDIMTSEWLRINKSGAGLYSQVHGNHIYSNNGNYWKMTGGGNAVGGLVFYQAHESNRRGYVYWDTASFGLLDSTGNWAVRIGDGGTSLTSYGALSVYGGKNGYSGISFPGNGTLMMHPSYSGFYNSSDNGWRWYVADNGDQFQLGTLYAGSTIEARGGVHNDTGAYLELKGGTSGKTKVTGNLVFPDGTEQSTAFPPGTSIGYARTQSTAQVVCTTVIPLDGTIPQITEGTSLLSFAYAAKRANSKLHIQAHVTGTGTTLGVSVIALFTSNSANAISASVESEVHVAGGQRWPTQLYLSAEYSPGSTSPVTYTLRGGSPLIMNGNGGTNFFGGASVSSLTITEIAQ